MTDLRHADPTSPGLHRAGRTRFRWVTADGDPATPEDAARATALVVPPAWTDVWVCADPRGHLQAVGTDAAGRRQYLYHQDWTIQRSELKFGSLPEFGHHVGHLRSVVDADLALPGMPRAKVVALVVALMDRTLLRVGNDRYADSNQSYGLTTLRSRNATVHGATIDLCFVGKGGKALNASTSDRRLARLVKRCQELPGQELFRWRDGGDVGTVTSSDVNDLLREHTEGTGSAKTFRTWGASVLAASLLAPVEQRTQRSANAALREVASELGNTLSVCRASYVHPAVLSGFLDGSLARSWADGPTRAAGGLVRDERRLLHHLEVSGCALDTGPAR